MFKNKFFLSAFIFSLFGEHVMAASLHKCPNLRNSGRLHQIREDTFWYQLPFIIVQTGSLNLTNNILTCSYTGREGTRFKLFSLIPSSLICKFNNNTPIQPGNILTCKGEVECVLQCAPRSINLLQPAPGIQNLKQYTPALPLTPAP